MVTIFTITINEPGGHNMGMSFQTNEDFESFITKFKKEADDRGYELTLKRKDGSPLAAEAPSSEFVEKH